MYYDDDYYFRPRKPDISFDDVKSVVDNQLYRVKLSLDQETRSFEELLVKAQEEAQERLKGLPSPYELYMSDYNKMFPESDQDKSGRLVGNYLRHKVTPYEIIMYEIMDQFWVPEAFFNYIWKVVMLEIVRKFPQIRGAYERGLKAKEEYPDVKYDYVCQAQELEAEAQREEYKKYLEKERERKQKESRLSQSLILKPNTTTLLVYQSGKLYTGEIIKVNKKTIKLRYSLKNGSEKEKLVDKLFLYINNKDSFEPDQRIESYINKYHKDKVGRDLKILT